MLLVLVVALVALGPTPDAGAQGTTHEVDVIAALTGPGAYIGKQDVDTLAAVERLVNKQGGVNGTPIHFTFHDDQTNPQISVQIATQLIAKGVPLIMGPSISATFRAVTPLVVQHGPVLYCLTPGVAPVRGGFQFSASIPTRDSTATVFDFLRKKQLHRLAILTSTDATGQDADTALDAVSGLTENRGIEIVAHEHFNNTDISLAAQMARIKAANPQILIAWSTGPPIGTVFTNIQQSGLDAPVVTTPANQTYQQMKQYATVLPKRLLFPSYLYTTGELPRANRAALEPFYQACTELGVKPDLQVGFAWDPTLIVVDALRHAGINATAEQLHAYIEQLHGFGGITGTYDFRDGNNRGVGASSSTMLEWDPSGNRFVPAR